MLPSPRGNAYLPKEAIQILRETVAQFPPSVMSENQRCPERLQDLRREFENLLWDVANGERVRYSHLRELMASFEKTLDFAYSIPNAKRISELMAQGRERLFALFPVKTTIKPSITL